MRSRWSGVLIEGILRLAIVEGGCELRSVGSVIVRTASRSRDVECLCLVAGTSGTSTNT